MKDEHLVMLGHMKGTLDSIKKEQAVQGETLSKVDSRLRHVEKKSAMIGAGSASVVTVGLTLLIETIKQKTGLGGS